MLSLPLRFAEYFDGRRAKSRLDLPSSRLRRKVLVVLMLGVIVQTFIAVRIEPGTVWYAPDTTCKVPLTKPTHLPPYLNLPYFTLINLLENHICYEMFKRSKSMSSESFSILIIKNVKEKLR